MNPTQFHPRAPTVLGLRFRNFGASAALVAAAIAAYRYAPYNARDMERLFGWVGFSFTGAKFLVNAGLFYIVLLAFHYLTTPQPSISKSLRCVNVIGCLVRNPRALARAGLERADRQAVLVTLLKAFFAPLMAMSLMMFLMGAIANGTAIFDAHAGLVEPGLLTLFDRYGFWFMIQTILFVDVAIFTVGYLVELPRLHNEIRSVDPTMLGWFAALICYPPFNYVTGKILGTPVSDFPHFDDPAAHVGLNVALLILMGVYAWASVALGWKASNLTHRGIVAAGPYAVVRHPAYVCKNMAWWIGSLPLVLSGVGASVLDGVLSVASVVAWSMIYVLRALTEEDHLTRVDGEYAAYAAKVRYRFIPGVY